MEALYRDGCCTLYIHPIITELSDFAKFFGGETETIVNRVQRMFKSSRRQRERLTARAVLHDVFGRYVEVSYSAEGKPSFGANDCAINISHSKTHVAVLLSTLPYAGVDIELVGHRILNLEQRIASPEELPANFKSFSDGQKAMALTALWTAKEAAYKSLETQSGINMLADIKVIGYDNETHRPARVSARDYGELCLHSLEFQKSICTFTSHSCHRRRE